jgi:hypothetical protein
MKAPMALKSSLGSDSLSLTPGVALPTNDETGPNFNMMTSKKFDFHKAV